MSEPAAEHIEIRDITALDDCRAVVGVQEAVWGRDGETVPASVLFVSAKRGGILLGAYISGELAGFVWSLVGTRDRRPTHWSHMLGVRPEWRQHRIGERLKQAQRTRALAAGVDLIEWTFDPLQAANAHFNLRALGAIGAGYVENVYGALAGPLHRGTPTDRLMVEWWIKEPSDRRMTTPPASSTDAPVAFTLTADGEWMKPRADGSATLDGARFVRVPVPARFSEMQQRAPELAMEWRLIVRDGMTRLFAQGYRAIDFAIDRASGSGAYLFGQS